MTRSQTPLALEYILLGLIGLDASYGYDLWKRLSSLDGIAAIWRVKQSRVYALLDKLEENGLLLSQMQPGEGHLLRKQFRATSIGRERFVHWMTNPVEHPRDMRQEFLARLFFARQAGPDMALDLVDAQVETCQSWRSAAQANLALESGGDGFNRIIAGFRLSQIEAMLAWLESSRKLLKGME